jgi:hypothetical protein
MLLCLVIFSGWLTSWLLTSLWLFSWLTGYSFVDGRSFCQALAFVVYTLVQLDIQLHARVGHSAVLVVPGCGDVAHLFMKYSSHVC